MPTVTALRPSRREGRVALHVDDRFLAAVGESFIVRHSLFVGLELTDDQLAALRADAAADGVLPDAYRLLAHRARSRAELGARLRAKGHAEAAVETVLEKLSGAGLLDDQAFAAAFVADKRRLAGWGAGRIARELDRLGVSAAIIGVLLPESDEAAADELARARAALARRGPAHPPLEPARKRAFEYLVRRGYSTTVAYRTVREWSAGASD
jgi:SOS response regulatory protein OraA/RecX